MIPFMLPISPVLVLSVAILALMAALGIQSYRLESIQNDFDEFVLETKAAGERARAHAEAVDAHHGLILEEMEHDIAEQKEARARERAARASRFDSLYRRYVGVLNANPGGDAVPKTDTGAAGSVLCFDRARFADGIRRDLGTLHAELESLAERSTGSLDAAAQWDRFARLTRLCPSSGG